MRVVVVNVKVLAQLGGEGGGEGEEGFVDGCVRGRGWGGGGGCHCLDIWIWE